MKKSTFVLAVQFAFSRIVKDPVVFVTFFNIAVASFELTVTKTLLVDKHLLFVIVILDVPAGIVDLPLIVLIVTLPGVDVESVKSVEKFLTPFNVPVGPSI
jgi:hypothetical protein